MLIGLVLLKLTAGQEKDTLSAVAQVSGVKNISGTFGRWDGIATVEAVDLEALASVIVSKIRAIKGVADTDTLIEVKL